MGQLHTVRQYSSTALFPMHTFMLLMVAKVHVHMKLKVQRREKLGEEVGMIPEEKGKFYNP